MNGNDIVFINDTPPRGYTEAGYLIVSVFTARGAIPIDDALVTINYSEPGTVAPHAVLTTNNSGRTPKISLPTPPRTLSLSPSEEGTTPPLPYALYNIEVVKEGFYPVTYVGVKIFSGITAIQNTDLIPVSEALPQSFYVDHSIYIDETGEDNL